RVSRVANGADSRVAASWVIAYASLMPLCGDAEQDAVRRNGWAADRSAWYKRPSWRRGKNGGLSRKN
ncbi:MAG: hypothetical protein ACYDEV_16700, partial [Acidiferrobacter sp.]